MSKAVGGRGDLRRALAFVITLGFGGSLAYAQSNDAPCPDSKLAPYGLAPKSGQYCSTPDCLLTFKNYKWWVAYHYNPNEGYYNYGLKTIFPPNNVSLGPDGNVHLKVEKQDNCKDSAGNIRWCGAEAVLMFDANGKQANLGYGDYLVSAKLVNPPLADWATLDPNVALGLFTFERPGTGTENNPGRELDLAEVTRWGWDHTGTCPYKDTDRNGNFNESILCKGSAQFAVQLVPQAGDSSVHRYDVGAVKEITLVMRWRNGSANFEQYNQGGLTLDTLPSQADAAWTPPDSLSKFVPTDLTSTGAQSCQRFHINLWLGNFKDTVNGINAGPSNPVEVVITNFEFKAAQ